MKSNKYTIIILTSIAFIIIGWGLAAPFWVSGDCMEPAIKDGQLYFLNRIAPYLRQYQTNDIVLLKYEHKIWIARILALENETIQINENSIIINGIPITETIQRNWSGWNYGTYALNETLSVPPGYIYMYFLTIFQPIMMIVVYLDPFQKDQL